MRSAGRGGPVKVLYMLGLGRSGTTVLDLLLGGIDRFFSVGELQSLWKESIGEGRLCGCGRPVAQCPVWTSVLRVSDIPPWAMSCVSNTSLRSTAAPSGAPIRRASRPSATVPSWESCTKRSHARRERASSSTLPNCRRSRRCSNAHPPSSPSCYRSCATRAPSLTRGDERSTRRTVSVRSRWNGSRP